MNETAANMTPPVQSLRECLRRSLVWVAVMVVFSVAILACVWFAYMCLETTSGMRNYALATGIAAGIGASVCLAGAMQLLDGVLRHPAGPPRLMRGAIGAYKLALMVAQLAAISVAATSAMTLIFGFGIPGI